MRQTKEHQARYTKVSRKKTEGETYTPKALSDFVASSIVGEISRPLNKGLRVLDPAIGDGELIESLLRELHEETEESIDIFGFETNEIALVSARNRLEEAFPNDRFHLEARSFLEYVASEFGGADDLFRGGIGEAFDLMIANPPYVRTQVMGGAQSQILAREFGLSGRVDLYYAFIVAMSRVLKPAGVAGIIVSNRFMSTKSGESVRRVISEQFRIRHVWDLGDTKLFEAAVLPAVLLVEGLAKATLFEPAFSTVYETKDTPSSCVAGAIEALSKEGVVELADGRRFRVQHGVLDTGAVAGSVWRLKTKATDAWLDCVREHTWATFDYIGSIRVGVKTCADKVFIRSDWETLQEDERPELVRPLITHHVAARFKAKKEDKKKIGIIYPHCVVHGRRAAVNLAEYPRSKAYLEQHRDTLERRRYLIEAGREWYEIWVPQNPGDWELPKLVFRDIAEEPTFWIDLDGGIVNGDCYWVVPDCPEKESLLWLAVAVANSTFIEDFYDRRFNNKLYSGRRRFITQYVEKFPLPDPSSVSSKTIMSLARLLYERVGKEDTQNVETQLDQLVWQSFGLEKEIRG